MTHVRAGRRDVLISHPDKVMFPKARISKRQLADHYSAVGGAMAELIGSHPLVMRSFPGGINGPGFYMKNAQEHFPDWIRTATMTKRGGTVEHVLGNDAATFVYLANQNSIEFHAWPSRADRPARPDRVIFDLDPPGTKFAEVRATARELGGLLRDRGLIPFAMTTGSRGLHVTVPIERRVEFPEARQWALELGQELVAAAPKRLTLEFHKVKRGGRIFVDVNRNAYAQHAVAPYSLRAREGAPVATPLAWSELDSRTLKPDGFSLPEFGVRLEHDPWSEFRGAARRIKLAAE